MGRVRRAVRAKRAVRLVLGDWMADRNVAPAKLREVLFIDRGRGVGGRCGRGRARRQRSDPRVVEPH